MAFNPGTEYIKAPDTFKAPLFWKLNEFDKISSSLILRGTFLFDIPLEADELKTSLSKLLMYYPHLAGRMERGNIIHQNNAGVPFTLSDKSAFTLEDLKNNNLLADHFSTPLSPSKIRHGTEAPMTVKLTKLANGSVIGIRCSHSCLDGVGFYKMIYNWGNLCKGETIEQPVLDQSLIPQPSNHSKKDLLRLSLNYGWQKLSPFTIIRMVPKLISGRLLKRTNAYYFSLKNLEKLKSQIFNKTGYNYSTHVLISAFITNIFSKSHKHGEKTSFTVVTVLNTRNRLPGVPNNFAGNAAFSVNSEKIPIDYSIPEIAGIIHDNFKPLLKNNSKELLEQVTLAIDMIHKRMIMIPYNINKMHTKNPTTIYINNFSKIPIYDINFGSGVPIHVIPHNLPDPVLIWPAHPKRGGVEVYFTGYAADVIKKLTKNESLMEQLTTV